MALWDFTVHGGLSAQALQLSAVCQPGVYFNQGFISTRVLKDRNFILFLEHIETIPPLAEEKYINLLRLEYYVQGIIEKDK